MRNLSLSEGVRTPVQSTGTPEDPLSAFHRLWKAARRESSGVLNESWEQALMQSILAEAPPDQDLAYWLARRLYGVVAANAAVVLLTVGLLWEIPGESGFSHYFGMAIPDYGILL